MRKMRRYFEAGICDIVCHKTYLSVYKCRVNFGRGKESRLSLTTGWPRAKRTTVEARRRVIVLSFRNFCASLLLKKPYFLGICCQHTAPAREIINKPTVNHIIKLKRRQTDNTMIQKVYGGRIEERVVEYSCFCKVFLKEMGFEATFECFNCRQGSKIGFFNTIQSVRKGTSFFGMGDYSTSKFKLHVPLSST